MSGDPFWLGILLAVIPAILVIVLHEVAHGLCALALGDDTALRQGRLTLNPIRHIDRVGTIIVPAVLIIGQLLSIGRVAFTFGWAKPVPVAAWRFRGPFWDERRGMALVAAAGPAANFVLAWLGALSLHGLGHVPLFAREVTETLMENFILINLVLGLFNLLPIPPLDGGRIMVGLLPPRWAARWARLERAGLVIVLALLLVPRLVTAAGYPWDPVGTALDGIVPEAFDLVCRLAFLNV